MLSERKKKSLCESSSVAQLFSSSLELDQNRYQVKKHQNSNLEKEKVQIIKKLMSESSMEEILDRYYDRNSIEYKVDPRKSSYDTSAATERLRNRLIHLMGTDVIRLNDRRYTDQLTERLQEEYENSLEKKEKQLAKAEEDRLRKLMLAGLIEVDEDFLLPSSARVKEKKSGRRRKTEKGSGKGGRSNSGSGRDSEGTVGQDENFGQAVSDEAVLTQMQVIDKKKKKKKVNNSKSSSSAKSKEKERPISRDLQRKSKRIESKQKIEINEKRRMTPVENPKEKEGWKSVDNDDQKSNSSSPKNSRPASRNPVHEALRNEETVQGLYATAFRMVPV